MATTTILKSEFFLKNSRNLDKSGRAKLRCNVDKGCNVTKECNLIKGYNADKGCNAAVWYNVPKWRNFAKPGYSVPRYYCYILRHIIMGLSTVWPDDGIKSCPISPQNCPKSSHTLFTHYYSDIIWNSPKSHQNFWATFVRQFVAKNV